MNEIEGGDNYYRYEIARMESERFNRRKERQSKMLAREMMKRADPLVNEDDTRVMFEVAIGLVEVGKEDDIQRLRQWIEDEETEDKFEAACKIAIAFIRHRQDLKEVIRCKDLAGYL